MATHQVFPFGPPDARVRVGPFYSRRTSDIPVEFFAAKIVQEN
jgi:hypothetical protein